MATTESSIFDLIIEARSVEFKLTRASGTSATLSWTQPENLKVYAGGIVLISEQPLNPSNFPSDGVRYSPSTDLQNPNSKIGGAVVVAAWYSQFGGDLTISSVSVTGLDPNKHYYASIHLCSSIIQYHSIGIHSYPLDDSFGAEPNSSTTGVIQRNVEPPINPNLGDTYFNIADGKVYMWGGASWVNASTETVQTGEIFPATATQGQFFYLTTTKVLYIWNGNAWNKANGQQEGTPMSEKIGIGTDGSYDERANLIRVLKVQLGWPSVCVELTEESFNVAIGNALDEFRRRADNAYNRRYIFFTLKKEQSMYYLNDPRNGTDKIVDIINIFRVNALGSTSMGGENGAYSQLFFNQYYSGNMVDLLSIHLISSLSEDFEKIFAGNLTFGWNELTRQLEIFRKIHRDEKVVCECVMERTEQDLLTDRWVKQWIQTWAHAELKEILGMIRSKYPNLPGANGGLSLNGDMLINEARQDFDECLRQIRDFEVGNGGVEWGNVAFLMG